MNQPGVVGGDDKGHPVAGTGLGEQPGDAFSSSLPAPAVERGEIAFWGNLGLGWLTMLLAVAVRQPRPVSGRSAQPGPTGRD